MSRERIARLIVDDIEADLNDRRGLHLSTLDDEILAEIKQTWVDMIMRRLEELTG